MIFTRIIALLICFNITTHALHGQVTLIDNGATWKYYDAGNQPANQSGTAWSDLAYDDAIWPSGNAELGYGDGDEATVIASVYTAYFRHTFNVADPSLYASLDLFVTYDDAVAVYLNGVEIYSINLPAPPYAYNTFATATSSDNALGTISLENLLVSGDNVITAEVHQRSTTSSDLSFNLKLEAVEIPLVDLIDYGVLWKYYDAGDQPADQGSNDWNDPAFDDSSWSAGSAHMGYGDGDESTVISNSAYTFYVRHDFNVDNPSLYSGLDLNLTYDDGAVVYLNGEEIWSVNMPPPPYTYNTFSVTQSAENAFATTLLANTLIAGNNVLAVEIHQRSANSSDLSFNFNLVARQIPSVSYINYGSNWAYYDAGNQPADQGSEDWNDPAYDDSAWSAGPAHLGYGDGDEATVISNVAETAYFRSSFSVSDASVYTNIDLDLIYDDGAVVYLNGQEVWAVNMPAGPYTYDTFSVGVSSDNSNARKNIENLLVNGENVIAVEVHQVSLTSTDMSFDFKLTANTVTTIEIDRGPYLQKASPSSMTVKWRTSTATESTIVYGTDINNLDQTFSDAAATTEHEVSLTGLEPATVYYYELRIGTEVLLAAEPNLYFKTSPEAGTQEPITAWILGDCGTANSNQRAVRNAYYNYIGADHTDMILFLGDNAYNSGTDQEYQYAVFENMYEDKLKNTVAWSCLGNHDGYTADSDSQTGPYYDIFSFPRNGECGGVASGTEAYYSYDYGNVHFIVLDSYETDRSVGGAMYNWCQNDIQNTLADWIVAYWHHPPYTKGSHDSDTESQLIQMRQNFLPLLEDNGVDLVLSGHSHSYERSYFLNGHYGNANTFNAGTHTIGATGSGDGKADGNGIYTKSNVGTDAGKGAVYITTGSAGKISGGSLNHNAMFYSVSALGSCIMEVNRDTMHLKFLRETGAVDDYFTIVKTCLENIVLYNDIPTNTYHAGNKIISDGLVPSAGNVIFKAGNEVDINAEFEVEQGAVLEVLIEDCGN